MKKPEFTKEELALIEAKRKRDESLKTCMQEVDAVLAKHGMTLKVQVPSEFKITLEQRA